MISRSLDGETTLFLPLTLQLKERIRTTIKIQTQESVCITAFKNTDTHKVDRREVVTKVLQHQIRETMPTIRNIIGVTSLTITEEGATTLQLTGSHIRFILPVTFHHDVTREVICLTISQNNTLNFLQFVLLLELRKDLVKTYKCFIQRSTRQTQTRRNRVTRSIEITKTLCTSPDVDHLMF